MHLYVLQMRTSVRWVTPALMRATTPWAPTTARVPGASPSQLMAEPVRVYNLHSYTSQTQCCQHHYHTDRLK